MGIKVANYGVDLYKLTINDGGLIEFNTGGGSLNIDGDLTVSGSATFATRADLLVSDNTITLNDGESGPGVTLDFSGIIIDRGSDELDVNFMFDETLDFLNPITGTRDPGAFRFNLNNPNKDLRGIYTNSIQVYDDEDLYLINQGTGVVSVTGTVDYEKQIWNYDINGDIVYDENQPDKLGLNPNPGKGDTDTLVNVQGLRDYVKAVNLLNFQTGISSPTNFGSTRVQTFSTVSGDPASRVQITVDNDLVAQFEPNSSFIGFLNFGGSVINNSDPSSPLILNSSSESIVLSQPTTIERPDSVPIAPLSPINGVTLYAGDEADGGTGLYFVNDVGTTDEMISKSKALLYSILF